jgi:hypothetical protein
MRLLIVDQEPFVDEANRLKGDRTARKVIKGAKWLLLNNRELH